MARVYIETTIPSHYFDTRDHPIMIAWREATRHWWATHGPRYQLCTSAYVLRELAQSPRDKAAAGAALMRPVPLLKEPVEVHEVARHYIKNKLMPNDAGGDAMHLAFASLHACDFLLTWNQQHLANANKVRHLTVLNARLGLSVPVITTPLALRPEDR